MSRMAGSIFCRLYEDYFAKCLAGDRDDRIARAGDAWSELAQLTDGWGRGVTVEHGELKRVYP